MGPIEIIVIVLSVAIVLAVIGLVILSLIHI